MTPESALQKYFGMPSFRQPQRAIIDAVLAKKDTLVVMPTGGGKSLCFQLPALLLPGVTLVVSPLIALMKDQVDALQARGLPAGLLNSSQTMEEQRATLDAIRARTLKLVYVAPERFRSQSFLNALPGDAISLFAIDEAHCLSQWGHDFRPDYMRLGEARKTLGSPPCIALTATATPDVQADIMKVLEMREPAEFVAGFARENLSFKVRKVGSNADKQAALLRLIKQHKTGIVYCATRKSVDTVAAAIEPLAGSVIRYHGGLSDKERTEAQEIFMQRKSDVVVATNAFGMGIDRADIRFVCHYEMPGSVEAYYQEGGRAGRDGAPSVCEMLFSYADKRVQDFFIEGANPGKDLIADVFDLLCGESDENHEVRLPVDDLCERLNTGRKVNPMAVSTSISVLSRHKWIERFDVPGRRLKGTRILKLGLSGRDLPLDGQALAIKAQRDEARLKAVIDFAYASGCRQQWILNYFGERDSAPCGRCDGCRNRKQLANREVKADEWTLVKMALSGVARMSQKRGRDDWEPRFGKRKIIQCLMGSQSAPILDAGLDALSTYGILKREGSAFVDALFECFEEAGLVKVETSDGFPLLKLTALGSQVMRGAATPALALPERTAGTAGKVTSAKKLKKGQAPDGILDNELYQKLAAKRSELAAANGKPAYTIFPNFVLVELANLKPTSEREAIKIRGIGPAKLKTVLPPFLEVIKAHL